MASSPERHGNTHPGVRFLHSHLNQIRHLHRRPRKVSQRVGVLVDARLAPVGSVVLRLIDW